MKIYLIVYIVGVLITAIILVRKEIKKGYITYKDLLGDLLLCVFSWLTILIWIVIWVEDNWNKEIWREKDEH